MNLRTIVTAVPLVRRAWRVLPGPLKLPVLVVGAGVVVYRRMTDGRHASAGTQPPDTTSPSPQGRPG